MAFVRRIIHLDTDAATELAVLSSAELSDSRAISASFTKLRIGGDAEGDLKLKDSFLDRGSLETGQFIAFEYSEGVRWYLGRIEEIVEHSPNEVDVSLYGMWSELNEVFPGGFAESNIGKPHRFQASDFNPNDPDFSYQTADTVTTPSQLVAKLWELYIAPSTNVGLGILETCDPDPGLDGFVLRGTESAAELLRSLAVLCNNASVGVDENGLLYFRRPNSTLLATFQEGVDCEALQRRTDHSLLYNYMTMTGGYIYGADTTSGFYRYTANFKHESSVTQYGQRGLHIYLPWLRRNRDAEAFATNFFTRYARPTNRTEFKTNCQTAILKPQAGQIEVLDRNGDEVQTDYFDKLQVEFNHCPIFAIEVGPEDVQFPASPEPDRWELGTPLKPGDGEPAPPGPIPSQNIPTYLPPESSSAQPIDNGGGDPCFQREPNGVRMGGSGVAWQNPLGATGSISSTASATLEPGQSTRTLVAKNFGFDSSDIPDNYVVDGITVKIWVEADSEGGGEDIHETTVQLTTNGLTGSGDNKAQGAAWTENGEFNEYGSSNDAWGLSLGATDIRSPDFGVVIQAQNFGASTNTGYVSSVLLSVCSSVADSSGVPSANESSSGAPSSDALSSDATSGGDSSDAPSDDEIGLSSGSPSSDGLSSDHPSSNAPSSDAPSSNAPSSNAPSSGAPSSGIESSGVPSSDAASSDSPSGAASSGGANSALTSGGGGGGTSGGGGGTNPNECAECFLPNTLYVRRVSNDSLVETLQYTGDTCTWTSDNAGFGYGFIPGEGTVWYFDCSNLAGGTQEYQGSLDSCTGSLMQDGGTYYVSDT